MVLIEYLWPFSATENVTISSVLLFYAAVIINFIYYAQYHAHLKDLCLGIQYFAIN